MSGIDTGRIPPRPRFGDVFEPILQGVSDLSAFVELTFEGLSFGVKAPETISRIRRTYELTKSQHPLLDEAVYTKSIENATRLQEFAKREAERSYPYMYGLALVKLLAIIEALVGEVALQVLIHNPSAWATPAVQAVKGPLVPFEQLPIHARAETIISSLRRDIEAKPALGIAKFENLLDGVGFGGEMHPLIRKAFLELREVRNCLIHRNGRADPRILELCPWLGLTSGQELLVDHSGFSWYLHAALWYEFELWLRWLKLEPPDPEEQKHLPSLNEGKKEFIEMMEGFRGSSQSAGPGQLTTR
jgi:hypothetical protein